MVQRYTVKDLGRLAGVSVRTLHHYDAIGLLKPLYVAENGYRHYGRDELLRLQEILVLRELDLPLAEIAAVIDADGSDRAARLAGHRMRLIAQAERQRRIIQTLDRTIASLNGERVMTDVELYEGFSPEKQAQYEAWLVERYGEEMAMRIEAAKKALAAQSPHEGAALPKALMEDLKRIEGAMVDAFEAGATPQGAPMVPLLEAHRAWIARTWDRPCDAAAYGGLAELYLAHPDFVARYETLAPGFSAFLTDAMKAHAARAEGGGPRQ